MVPLHFVLTVSTTKHLLVPSEPFPHNMCLSNHKLSHTAFISLYWQVSIYQHFCHHQIYTYSTCPRFFPIQQDTLLPWICRTRKLVPHPAHKYTSILAANCKQPIIVLLTWSCITVYYAIFVEYSTRPVLLFYGMQESCCPAQSNCAISGNNFLSEHVTHIVTILLIWPPLTNTSIMLSALKMCHLQPAIYSKEIYYRSWLLSRSLEGI